MKNVKIKVAFQPLFKVLAQANEASKIDKAVYSACIDLMEAKRAGGSAASAVLRDNKKAVVAIKCYYYKRWMPVVGTKLVAFGKKTNTGTGLNSMCKTGYSLWTKQLSTAKKAKEQMLVDVQNGKLKPADIAKHIKKIDEAREIIAPTKEGFKTLAEVKAYLKKEKFVVADS